MEALIGIFILIVASILWNLLKPKPTCPHGVRKGSTCRKCVEAERQLALQRESTLREVEDKRRRQFLQKQEQLAQTKEAEFQRIREVGALRKVDPYSFEMLCASLYEKMGWSTWVTPKTGDGGIDAVIERGQERRILQCKRLRSGKVGVGPVRDLFGVIQSEDVAGGILITTTGFTAGAAGWATGKNIELIDGASLVALLRQHFPDSGSLPDALAEQRLTQDRIARKIQKIKDILNSPCPLCGKSLVVKKGKFGEFIGCSGYPDCRHTRDIEPFAERCRGRKPARTKGGKRVTLRLD